MKKRRVSLILILAAAIFLLAGCTPKAMNPEAFSQVFVNRLIYGGDEDKFKEAYRDADNFIEEMDGDVMFLEEIVTDSFESAGADITDAQSKSITDSLLNAVRTKTSYEVKNIQEGDNGSVTVTYAIKGLDFPILMKDWLNAFIVQLQANPSLMTDEDQMTSLGMQLFDTSMKNIQARTEAVEVSLDFDLDRGKWYVPEDQQDNAESLIFAFFFGARDEDAFEAEINQIMGEVMASL